MILVYPDIPKKNHIRRNNKSYHISCKYKQFVLYFHSHEDNILKINNW